MREGSSTRRAGRGKEGKEKVKDVTPQGGEVRLGKKKEEKGGEGNQPAPIEQTGRKRHFNERPLSSI